ncbi:hypothetical protein CBR_g24308 [Chara braunii]|uniref:Reverse transcriptase domain-containing protein n=1 Tax=Chara braunii TaxID=69332 RepID=A0A388JMD1_CHABU|nr:hypothetical protein CBR_g24308 [Chara braunii]|eukprot:GBG58958.1 hypothetical protein CBR_g24308 [Chara braunii]
MEVGKLMQLYTTAGAFSEKGKRKEIKELVGKVIRKKIGVNARHKTTVSVRYDRDIKKREVRAELQKWISESKVHAAVKGVLKRRARVVWKRNRTVANILCNHIAAAKSEEGECTCARYDLPRAEGHVVARIAQVPGVKELICNGKNITRPTRGTEGRELGERIFTALKAAMWDHVDIQQQDIQVERCYVQQTHASSAITEEEVAEVRKRYGHLVITPMDRNAGEIVLLCPSTYQHALKKMFIYNGAYRQEEVNEKEAMAAARDDYKKARLEKIAEWDRKGKVGCAEPTKTGSRRVARALNVLLARLPEATHFNMGVTTHLKEKLTQVERRCNSKKGEAMVLLRSYDIKEMFTSLPHNAIRNAVDWLLQEWEARGREKVSVSRRGREVVMNQRSRGKGYVQISFQLIREYVKFELNHTYTTCRGRLLKQIIGIPMGKNSSPPLACILCARYETRFMRSLGKDRALFQGISFMDDVTTGVLVDKRNEGSFRKAERIMEAFEECYGRRLVLVKTDEGGNTIDFIGTKVTATAGPIRFLITPQLKNQETIINRDIPFKSFQDYHSYSDKRAKYGAIIGTLHRIRRLTNAGSAVIQSIMAMRLELRRRGYPPTFFASALAKFARGTIVSEDSWRTLLDSMMVKYDRRVQSEGKRGRR